MAQPVCTHNKFGYCKFAKHCHQLHNDLLCENESCDKYCCDKRHPKPCRYNTTYKMCKFGTFCKYLHLENVKVGDNCEIKQLQEKILQLENELIRDKHPDWKHNKIDQTKHCVPSPKPGCLPSP